MPYGSPAEKSHLPALSLHLKCYLSCQSKTIKICIFSEIENAIYVALLKCILGLEPAISAPHSLSQSACLSLGHCCSLSKFWPCLWLSPSPPRRRERNVCFNVNYFSLQKCWWERATGREILGWGTGRQRDAELEGWSPCWWEEVSVALEGNRQ